MPYTTLNSGEPGIRGLLRTGRPRSTAGPADAAGPGRDARRASCPSELPGAYRSALAPPSPAGADQAGWMLALKWNRLPGSYSALIRASRSYLAGP